MIDQESACLAYQAQIDHRPDKSDFSNSAREKAVFYLVVQTPDSAVVQYFFSWQTHPRPNRLLSMLRLPPIRLLHDNDSTANLQHWAPYQRALDLRQYIATIQADRTRSVPGWL